MTKKSFVTTVLFGLLTFAQASGDIPKSKVTQKVVDGFTTISEKEEKAKFECENIEMAPGSMPRVRSQGMLPLCQSYAAATVIQFQLCKHSRVADCSQVSPKDEVSPLSVNNKLQEDMRGAFSPNKIQMFPNHPGGAVDGIQRTHESFVLMPEACFPMDQFLNKYGDNSAVKMKEIIAILNKELSKAKTEASICSTCLEGALIDLGSTVPLDDLKKKLVEYHNENIENKKNPKKLEVVDIYSAENIMHDLTLDQCKEKPLVLRLSQKPEFGMFPTAEGDKDMEKMMAKTQEVLSTGNPVAFDGVCLGYEKGKCIVAHSVVIHGYKKLCDNNKCNSGCRRAFRIQNSWGEDWQKENNNGLVDAEDLLSYSTYKGDDKLVMDMKKKKGADLRGVLTSSERIENTLSWMIPKK